MTEEDLARFFVPEKLDSCYSNNRILIFNGYHIYFTAGLHRKLVRNGGY